MLRPRRQSVTQHRCVSCGESAERTTCPTGSEVSSTQSKSRDKVRDVAQGLGQKKPLEVLLAVHPGEPDSVCSELGGRELVLCGQVSELTRVGRELVRVAVRRHVVRHDVHTRHLVLLLPLHTPILEPDLYLTLCKTEGMRDLDATPPRQIAVEVELLFQLQGLVPGVRGPLPFRLAIGIHRTWKSKGLVIARGQPTWTVRSVNFVEIIDKSRSGESLRLRASTRV